MAAKPYPFIRFRAGGQIGTGNSWSIGLAVQSAATSIDTAALTAWLDGIAPDVAASFATEANAWGSDTCNDTHLAVLDAYAYNAGSAASHAQGVHNYTTPIAGVSSTKTASMIAMCCTLLTGTPGRKNQGRIYVPADGAAFPNHRFNSVDVTSVTKGVVSLIDHLNGSTLSGDAVSVGVATMTAFRAVTSVRTDDNPDTQRPRAGAKTFTYSDPV